MALATVSYPGVLAVKELHYTQSLSVEPDTVALRIVPQLANVADAGTVSIGYTGQTTITLPNCSIDSARTTYNTEGFVTSVILLDRRELWKYSAPVNGRYNIVRNGTRLTATEKTLRELVELLLLAVGESSPDVSNVSASIYPEVNWYCDEPHRLLQTLLEEWGYGVALGFGSESVVVHELGVGTALPTDAIMMQSSGVDAKIQPEYVRTCFGANYIQARFELEAVALDTDGIYDLPGDVSYKPAAGWESVPPTDFQIVEDEYGADERELARRTLYRHYRVKQFSDGDLLIPDGSGITLDAIDQCFPLQNRLLETLTTRTGETLRDRARIFGVCRLPENSTGQPRAITDTSIDDEIFVDFVLDGERGLVKFYDPMFKMTGDNYKPADLYLECTFSVRANTINQWIGYYKDTLFDSNGFGFATLKRNDLHLETVVAYNAGHAANIPGNSTNQTTLDTLAPLLTTAVAGRYTNKQTQMVVYQEPRLALRCDGLRQQVTHIVSDGEEEPGSYSIASAGMEYDRFIASLHDRAVRMQSLNEINQYNVNVVVRERPEEAND